MRGISFDFLPYCFCFVDVHKLDFLFRNYSIRFVCVAFFLRVLKEKGERQVRKIMPGKRPWGFSPRAFRADECGRSTRDPRFPSGESSLFFIIKII